VTDLRDARVLITAGGRGIGATLARRFAGAGARVAICDVDDKGFRDLEREIEGLVAMRADVTNERDMAAVFAQVDSEFHGLDVVCANAGIGGPAGGIETLSLSDWRACLSVNLDGAFLACRGAAVRMMEQGAGSVLLTSSTAGLFGYPGRSPYATAKWGIVGLMKTLAMELGPHGVRVNAICPGAVEGDRMERVLAAESAAHGTSVEEMRASYVRGVSMRTWISADEVADVALFLASDAGKRISGQTIAVDGHTETLNA